MDTIDIIKTRRSIRQYTDKKISDETLKKIVEAGMYAPSAGNEQPWEFLIITDKKILEKISSINPYASMTKDAQAAILICGDVNKEKYKGFWIQDCSAATQNILLAAHSMGIGSVWTAIYPIQEHVEKFKKTFDLSENILPFALIPLGYPKQSIKQPNRYNEERIHFNKW